MIQNKDINWKETWKYRKKLASDFLKEHKFIIEDYTGSVTFHINQGSIGSVEQKICY